MQTLVGHKLVKRRVITHQYFHSEVPKMIKRAAQMEDYFEEVVRQS